MWESCTKSDQRGSLAQDPTTFSSHFNRKSCIYLRFFPESDDFVAQDFSEQVALQQFLIPCHLFFHSACDQLCSSLSSLLRSLSNTWNNMGPSTPSSQIPSSENQSHTPHFLLSFSLRMLANSSYFVPCFLEELMVEVLWVPCQAVSASTKEMLIH